MTNDVKELQSTVLSLQQENEKLKQQLNWFNRQVFGTKSEKIPPSNNLDLFGEDSKGEPTSTSKQKISYTREVKVGHGRNPFPDHLEVKEEVIDVPEKEKVCACCGNPKKCIGQDESQKLEMIPAKAHVKKIVRPKYACSNCSEEGVTQSPMPPQLIPGGNCGTSMILYVILGKYLNHQPLERQSQDIKRQGLELAPSTMVGWIDAFCNHLNPIVELMKAEVLDSKYIHTDDTGVPVKINKKKGKAHRGILWVYVGDHKSTVFEYTHSRKGQYPQDFLKNYEGYVHADGYSGYDKIYQDGRIKECMCWSHARRKYFEAYDQGDTRAKRPLQLMGWLFRVERYMKENSYDDTAKRELRQKLSRKILDKLYSWLKENEYDVLPGCDLGKGMKYTLKNWGALQTYLEEGFLEMTNNLSERHLRKVVLGRSNWVYCGSEKGAERAALIYSIVGTCKQLDIDPYQYLSDVLEKLLNWPKEKLYQLTPLQWKKSNP